MPSDISPSFQPVLDALPDAAIHVGPDRRVIASNALVFNVLGINPDGQDITQVIRTPVFTDAFQRVGEGAGKTEFEMEFFGRKRQLAYVFITALTGTGGFLVVIRDFTREQAVEKMRSDFVANASHEMRTPLASIIGSIETLQGAAKDDAKARDMFLGTMLTQAHRMKRLIDDLLVLSRIELNEHVRPNARVALNDVARQSKANLAVAATDAKVSVDVDARETVVVAGDAEELLQVAQNLIENAIKYAASGKRVEVSCYAHDGQGFLSIRDFGKGIADVHLPRLTERFYRVNTQDSRSRGGTGLGLAIVKHILLRHHGKLAVSSVEGQGSTFTVSIPLA
jgi:two-component system, OmpR family, phosphate regulon sensor histidine kinase PhoR